MHILKVFCNSGSVMKYVFYHSVYNYKQNSCHVDFCIVDTETMPLCSRIQSEREAIKLVHSGKPQRTLKTGVSFDNIKPEFPSDGGPVLYKLQPSVDQFTGQLWQNWGCISLLFPSFLSHFIKSALQRTGKKASVYFVISQFSYHLLGNRGAGY